MTYKDQIGSDDDKNILQYIAEHKREKQESLNVICELERHLQDKQKLETKIKDLQKKLQEAMKEADLSEELLHVRHNLRTGVEDLKLNLQGASDLTTQLESELDAKHKLETTIEELKQKLLVTVEGDTKKIEEIGSLKEQNQVLSLKEKQSNDELLETRTQLIRGFLDIFPPRGQIGIKKMGEIDMNLFHKALKKNDSAADIKAAEMCSFWQEKVQDPNWQPFKTVTSEDGSFKEEIVNVDDKFVKSLKSWGADIYEAVITALKEVKEYSPSDRCLMPEIWNFKEKRKATNKDAIAYMLKKLKMLKSQRS